MNSPSPWARLPITPPTIPAIRKQSTWWSPELYPKLRAKYGNLITFEDNPAAHLKTEFGFDVLEVAKGRYAPEDYHDFIGFRVAKPMLERAFAETYSIEMKDIFKNLDLALSTYRKTNQFHYSRNDESCLARQTQ